MPSSTGNSTWANDTSRFGFKLLQKMGWTEGKGLGKDEDGIVQPVRSRRNAKQLGMGAVSSSVTAWDATGVVANGFNDVLSKISAVGESAVGEPVVAAVTATDASPSIAEQPGQKRQVRKKARGYYERRRAGKTVGKYSADALREIFGDIGADDDAPQPVDSKADKTEDEHVSAADNSQEVDMSSVVEQHCESNSGFHPIPTLPTASKKQRLNAVTKSIKKRSKKERAEVKEKKNKKNKYGKAAKKE